MRRGEPPRFREPRPRNPPARSLRARAGPLRSPPGPRKYAEGSDSVPRVPAASRSVWQRSKPSGILPEPLVNLRSVRQSAETPGNLPEPPAARRSARKPLRACGGGPVTLRAEGRGEEDMVPVGELSRAVVCEREGPLAALPFAEATALEYRSRPETPFRVRPGGRCADLPPASFHPHLTSAHGSAVRRRGPRGSARPRTSETGRARSP